VTLCVAVGLVALALAAGAIIWLERGARRHRCELRAALAQMREILSPDLLERKIVEAHDRARAGAALTFQIEVNPAASVRKVSK
jgi:hypothetical protein